MSLIFIPPANIPTTAAWSIATDGTYTTTGDNSLRVVTGTGNGLFPSISTDGKLTLNVNAQETGGSGGEASINVSAQSVRLNVEQLSFGVLQITADSVVMTGYTTPTIGAIFAIYFLCSMTSSQVDAVLNFIGTAVEAGLFGTSSFAGSTIDISHSNANAAPTAASASALAELTRVGITVIITA